MNIIRDEECFGLMMIPLFIDWHVRRCNVENCKENPSTIVTGIEDCPPIGLCEEHFQAANQGVGVTYTFEWDDFDAFKLEEK
jgi:hypothetical protein